MRIEEVRQMAEKRQELDWIPILQTQPQIEETYDEFLDQQTEQTTRSQRLGDLGGLLPVVSSIPRRYRIPMLAAGYVRETYLEPLHQRAFNMLNVSTIDFITTFDVAAGMNLPLGSFSLAGAYAAGNFNPTFRTFIAEMAGEEEREVVSAVYAEGAALAREVIGFLHEHPLGAKVFEFYQQKVEADEELPGLLTAYSKAAILAGVSLAKSLYFGTVVDAQRVIRLQR